MPIPCTHGIIFKMPVFEHPCRETLELNVDIKTLLSPALHEIAIPLVEGALQTV
jgi:hypothetical protein